MRRWCSIVVIALLSGRPTAAAADEAKTCGPDDGLDASARRARGVAAYGEGERRGDRGAFRAAARCFEFAHEAEPSGPVLFNAAKSWTAADEPARAADAYARALTTGGLEPAYQKIAREQLAAAGKALMVVDAVRPRGRRLRVAHVDGDVPTTFHLEPGAHDVVITCPGEDLTLSLTARAGDKERLDLPCPDAAAPSPSPPPRRPPPDDDGVSALGVTGWTLLAVGGAGGAVALGLGIATVDARDEFRETRDEDVRARGEDLRLGTNISAFGGLALGLLGAGLLVYDAVADDGIEVAVSPSGVRLRGSF
ncbi:MAG: hypothetical protein AAF928_03790 [Myxococcota bacterium]